jgi:hypothetical protein
VEKFSPHFTPVTVEFLTGARVQIITFTSRPMQILQVLDLALFGVLKRGHKYRLPFGDEKGMPQFIKKVFHDFRRMMIDMNIWRAFQEIGLTFVIIDGVHRFVFNELKLRENRGFKDLYVIDFSPDDSPARGRRAQFDWVNSRYCGSKKYEKW